MGASPGVPGMLRQEDGGRPGLHREILGGGLAVNLPAAKPGRPDSWKCGAKVLRVRYSQGSGFSRDDQATGQKEHSEAA